MHIKLKKLVKKLAAMLLTAVMLLGTAGFAEQTDGKTVINRINNPSEETDFAFAEDAPLLEVIFPQILDCDAVFLRCGGETMLLDCATSGQSKRILNMCRQLGITHIDRVVNTHPHEDHIGGFAEIIKEISVDELWLCFPADETTHSTKAVRAAEQAGIAVKYFADGDTLTLGDAKLHVWMLTGSDFTRLNDRSAQILLSYGDRTMMFAADIEQKGQMALAGQYGTALAADVLKYPHHGKQALVQAYRDAVNPRLCIITCNQRTTGGKTYVKREGLDTVWTVPGFVTLTTDGTTWLCELVASEIKY